MRYSTFCIKTLISCFLLSVFFTSCKQEDKKLPEDFEINQRITIIEIPAKKKSGSVIIYLAAGLVVVMLLFVLLRRLLQQKNN